MKFSTSFLFINLLFQIISYGQTKNDSIELILDFPVLDIGYQSLAAKTTDGILSSYINPSMKQSLTASNNLYSTAHWGIKRMFRNQSEFKRILFSNSVAMAFDLLISRAPLSSVWLHEEYHRAVLTRREVNSFNDINSFPYGDRTVAVRKIDDSDLIFISDNHATDFRRLMSAGNEAGNHQIQSLQKNNFYYNQDLPHIPLYWISTMTNIFNVANSTSSSFDELVDEANAEEGSDIERRDFTGPDFTAWADALFFPEKPYEERGIHPSGVGINRYIKPSSLNEETQNYLNRQGFLQLLNVLSPHLFGFSKIKLFSNSKGDYFGNFAVRHILTPFGNDLNVDIFYQTPTENLFFAVHIYNNLNNTFGGVEAGIIDKQLFNDKLLISARSMIWLQPNDLSFFESQSSLGGLLSAKTSYSFGKIKPYLQVDAKSDGWVMGNVFLNENISLNMGLNIWIN